MSASLSRVLGRCFRYRRRFLMFWLSLIITCIVLKNLLTDSTRVLLLETYPTVPNFWELKDGPPLQNVSSNIRVPTVESTCTPKTHLVFLKTHKTGSSTILNILYRYGEKNKLRFAFPNYRFNQLSYPRSFNAKMVYGASNKSLAKPDIMCNHMRFNKSEVAKAMPADSFYFSLIRHPATMLESIFSYYKSFPIFKTSKKLADFFNDSLSNYSFAAFHNNYAHNNLAFDLGFNNTLTANSKDLEEVVATTIKSIEQDFQLILINEYFDESVIMLQHALCWSMEDILSFKLNSRNNKSRRAISEETVEKVKLWNALDWRIYLHFNATFWKRVDSVFGRTEMKRQVARLKELQAQKAQECLMDRQAINPSQIKDAMLKPMQYGQAVIQGYLLNPRLSNHSRAQCMRFIMPELQYTYYLYDRQIPMKPNKKDQKDKKDPKDKKSLQEDHKGKKDQKDKNDHKDKNDQKEQMDKRAPQEDQKAKKNQKDKKEQKDKNSPQEDQKAKKNQKDKKSSQEDQKDKQEDLKDKKNQQDTKDQKLAKL